MDEKEFLDLVITERMAMHFDSYKKENPAAERQDASTDEAFQVHEQLYGQLDERQRKMMELCEDAVNLEASWKMEFFYRAGFRDGISLDRLIKQFKEGK